MQEWKRLDAGNDFGFCLAVVVDDPSDDVLLKTAVEHGASWLVAGDKRYLLKIKPFQGKRKKRRLAGNKKKSDACSGGATGW